VERSKWSNLRFENMYSKLCRLISKFSVSSTSHQHIRIADVSLDLPSGGLNGVTIRSASIKRPVVVSFENFLTRLILTKLFLDCYSSATCDFYVCSRFCSWSWYYPFCLPVYFLSLMTFSVRESLVLTIKYRMLREGETNRVHPFHF
jgi:hypothetical protein